MTANNRNNPVSKGYPNDGSCPYCGANDWTLDCGVFLCCKCDNYDEHSLTNGEADGQETHGLPLR